MDDWKTSFLLGWPIFRCYVSFREGIIMYEMVNYALVNSSSLESPIGRNCPVLKVLRTFSLVEAVDLPWQISRERRDLEIRGTDSAPSEHYHAPLHVPPFKTKQLVCQELQQMNIWWELFGNFGYHNMPQPKISKKLSELSCFHIVRQFSTFWHVWSSLGGFRTYVNSRDVISRDLTDGNAKLQHHRV